MAKGSGGKAFTGILCFILGFIIAIVAEVAIIAGGVYWLLNTDLDSIFNTIGIENEEETEDGTKYIYINTDTSSGGVSTVLDLVSKLQDLAGKGTDTLTLGEFTDLLPVADNLVDSVYSMLASTLDMTEDEVRELIDETELKATPIAELSTFLLDSIYQIQLDKVLELAGIQVDSSSIYLALAYGSSANTIDIDGKTYPLYYEEFTAKEAGTSGGAQTASISLTADSGSNSADVVYYTSDGTAIDSTSVYYSYISEVSSSYKLYYYVIDGTAYVAQRNSASDYSVVTDTSSGSSLVYSLYDADTATLTGGYYYDENNELVALTHRTLNDLVNVNDEGEAGIDAMLGDLYISDLIEDETIQSMFEGISLGDLMNDENISDTLLESIYLSDFLDDDSDPLLVDMLEGKTLADIMNSDDIVSELFDGIYVTELLDESADDALSSIFDGVYVSDLLNGNFSFDDVAIGDLLGDVTSEDAIMQYLVYGVSGLDFTTYVGSYDVTEDVTDDEGKVTQVITTYYVFTATYHDYGGNSYPAYVVATLGTNVSGDEVYTITDAYYYPITDLDFTSTDYKTDTIEGVTYYTFTATYTDEDNKENDANVVATLNKDSVYVIQEVYYIGSVTEYDEQGNETTEDNVEIDLETAASTSVNGINGRIDGLMNDLTIGEITDLGDSKLANKLSDYTIDEIDKFIDELTLADVMDVTLGEDSSNLMLYIVYGVNGLNTDNPVILSTVTTTEGDTETTVTTYVYTGTYNSLGTGDKNGEDDITVYVVVEETVVIEGEKTTTTSTVTGVYSDAEYSKEVTGTPVNDVSDRINGLMNDLTIGEIATNLGTSALANKLSGYTINEIDKFIDELTLADVLGEVDSEDSNIIIYLVYGINKLDFTTYVDSYDVTEDAGEVTQVTTTYYVFEATYHDYDGNSYPAYVVATRDESNDGDGGIVYTYTITDAYYYPITGLDFTSYDSSYTEDGVTYYTFTATYTDEDNKEPACVVATLNEESVYVIQEVYYIGSVTEYDEQGNETTKDNVKIDLKTAASTSVNDISDRIDGLMNDLTIGEIATNLGDTKLATKLSGYTVNQIDQFIDDLTLADVIEEVAIGDGSSNIMMYIVYGISGFEYDSDVGSYVATYNSLGIGDANSETDITTVYIKVEEKEEEGVKTTIVTGVYTTYENGEYSDEISGTPVGKVSARVEGLMNDLTIGELIDITDNSSVILKAIKDSTINSLSGDISNLTIQELFYDTIYSAAASVSDYTIDQYVKVVYESISSAGGTYYYYNETNKTLTNCSYSKDYLTAGTLYWKSGSSDDTTIYQVVSFDSGYLYFVSDGKGDWNYVQYSGNNEGHLSSYGEFSSVTGYTSGAVLYTYGEPDGVWYFMLYSSSSEVLYTIDEIGSLTTNAATNIEHATLYKLVDAGVLSSISKTDLATPVNWSIIEACGLTGSYSEESGGYVSLGNLYLTDTITVFLKILNQPSLLVSTGGSGN